MNRTIAGAACLLLAGGFFAAPDAASSEFDKEMTLQGKYGPNFTASGNLGTVRMSVQGTLSEHPDQPELLQGSGTGQTTDSSELQVSCKFSWRTSP